MAKQGKRKTWIRSHGIPSIFGLKPGGKFITGRIGVEAAKRLEAKKVEVARAYEAVTGKPPRRPISTAEAIEYMLYGIEAVGKFV